MHSTRRGMEQKDWEEPTKRKTGPNDVNHVVWAIGAFFFHYTCFYVYLIMFIGFTGIVELRKVIWEGTTRRTGPNDTYHVVCAISTCFSILIVFIFFTNSYLQDYRCYGATEGPT